MGNRIISLIMLLAGALPVYGATTAQIKENAPDQYTVQRGDTLWQVAQRFGTTIRSLMELNNLNESGIYAGQILLVK